HLNFILTVYADPEQADQDRSRLLSPAEAFSLAVALSLDGLAVGFGAALGSVGVWQSLLFSLFIGAGAVRLGAFLGNRLAS
ncbi:manganese efflux pump, partial [Escherichia coli]|nr:manganese efflux pump [Escherichia coli]